MMKVEITGCVYDAKGKMTGIVELDEQEAERLLALKVVKPVKTPEKEAPAEVAPVSEAPAAEAPLAEAPAAEVNSPKTGKTQAKNQSKPKTTKAQDKI